MRRSIPLVLLPLFLCNADAAAQTGPVDGTTPSADGVPIHYQVRGEGEPTLVLIHGWMNTMEIWGRHLETLPATHRVVAIELAGHGSSGRDRAEWTMDAFGEDVVAVVEALGLEEVVLVGFSMGAIAALEAAERMPGRTLGVVFVDQFNDEDRAMTKASARQIEDAFRANWGDSAFVRAFAFSPDAPNELVYGVTASLPEEPEERYFEMLPNVTGWIEAEFESTLRGLDVPVAAINSTRVPTDVEAMRDLAPGFTLDTLQGLGHAGVLLRRTEAFDARLLGIVDRFTGAPE